MELLREAKMSGKKIIVRFDCDLPMEADKIVNDKRIRACLPTIKYILDQKPALVVLIGHMGRPGGRPRQELRLKPVAERLAKYLGISEISFEHTYSTRWTKPKLEVYHLKPNILLLENIRFYPEEEKNDAFFARKLASLGDIYVFESFATAHRAHASVVGLPKRLPAYTGFQVEQELNILGSLISSPKKPFIMVLGGAKAENKIPIIKNLIGQVDVFLFGGVIGNTFLTARGYQLGKSKVEPDRLRDCLKIWSQVMDSYDKDIYLPRDFMINPVAPGKINSQIIDLNEIKDYKDGDYKIVDIGPQSLKIFNDKISEAKTLFWNGNLGISEIELFATGTKNIAHAIAKNAGITIAGGGDTVSAIENFGLDKKFTFLSTGGGATLEFLAGKVLPGIEALG